MTPTEQDKGVFDMREWLKNEGWLWHESHVITPECMDDMQTALDKYAKRVALEARTAENRYWKRRYEQHSDEDTAFFDVRIAELKAQQEEVK